MSDQKISALTNNPGIDGTEEMPTARGGSNFKNTFNALKSWIGAGDIKSDGTVDFVAAETWTGGGSTNRIDSVSVIITAPGGDPQVDLESSLLTFYDTANGYLGNYSASQIAIINSGTFIDAHVDTTTGIYIDFGGGVTSGISAVDGSLYATDGTASSIISNSGSAAFANGVGLSTIVASDGVSISGTTFTNINLGLTDGIILNRALGVSSGISASDGSLYATNGSASSTIGSDGSAAFVDLVGLGRVDIYLGAHPSVLVTDSATDYAQISRAVFKSSNSAGSETLFDYAGLQTTDGVDVSFINFQGFRAPAGSVAVPSFRLPSGQGFYEEGLNIAVGVYGTQVAVFTDTLLQVPRLEELVVGNGINIGGSGDNAIIIGGNTSGTQLTIDDNAGTYTFASALGNVTLTPEAGWAIATGTSNLAALTNASTQTEFNQAVMAIQKYLFNRGFLTT